MSSSALDNVPVVSRVCTALSCTNHVPATWWTSSLLPLLSIAFHSNKYFSWLQTNKEANCQRLAITTGIQDLSSHHFHWNHHWHCYHDMVVAAALQFTPRCSIMSRANLSPFQALPAESTWILDLRTHVHCCWKCPDFCMDSWDSILLSVAYWSHVQLVPFARFKLRCFIAISGSFQIFLFNSLLAFITTPVDRLRVPHTMHL
jgi:hypothetical protein